MQEQEQEQKRWQLAFQKRKRQRQRKLALMQQAKLLQQQQLPLYHPTPSLYVGNIHTQVTETLLQKFFFSKTGVPIKGCKLIRKTNATSYGFVDYFDHKSVALAIFILNERYLLGQPIKVNWAYKSTSHYKAAKGAVGNNELQCALTIPNKKDQILAMEPLIPAFPDEIAREILIRVPRKKFSEIIKVSRRWKEEVESSKFHLKRKARGYTQVINVFKQDMPSDRAVLSLYEPDTGVWSRVPFIPGFDFSELLSHSRVIVGVRRKLVVISWTNPLSDWEFERLNCMFIYDFVSETWRRGTNMPGDESREFYACSSDYERMVFVAGGYGFYEEDGKDGTMLRSAMAYNVEEDKWIPMPDMATPRAVCKGVVHGGKFHVIMSGDHYTPTQRLESFDIATWQWDQVVDDVLEKLSIRPWEECPISNRQNKLYACTSNGTVEVLEDDDDVDAMWKTVAKIPNNASRISSIHPLTENQLLVFGYSDFSSKFYMLETKHCTWTKVDVPKEYSHHTWVTDSCCLEI